MCALDRDRVGVGLADIEAVGDWEGEGVPEAVEEADPVRVLIKTVEDTEADRHREKELVAEALVDPVKEDVGDRLVLVVTEWLELEVAETLGEGQGVREGDKVEVTEPLGHCEAEAENVGREDVVRVTEAVLQPVEEVEGVGEKLMETVLVAEPVEEVDRVGVTECETNCVEEEEGVDEWLGVLEAVGHWEGVEVTVEEADCVVEEVEVVVAVLQPLALLLGVPEVERVVVIVAVLLPLKQDVAVKVTDGVVDTVEVGESVGLTLLLALPDPVPQEVLEADTDEESVPVALEDALADRMDGVDDPEKVAVTEYDTELVVEEDKQKEGVPLLE